MAALDITIRTEGPATIMDLAGALNLATAPGLAGRLGALLIEGRRHLILDMRRLGSCDAAGLRSVRGGVMRTQVVGGTLCLVHTDARFIRLVGASCSWRSVPAWPMP